MPSYRHTLNHLYGLKKFGIKPGLERIRTILDALGDPQRCYPSLLVGGTNGKGSTAAILSSVCSRAGLAVGLYTSPHLERFNERIRFCGSEITDREVAAFAERVRAASEARREQGGRDRATFFEYTTAMALEYFRVKGADLAVLEVGMGGRLDATNVVDPLVSIITTIGLDHEEFLGDDLEGIALDKAGIIKDSTPVVAGVDKGPAAGLVEEVATQKGAAAYLLGRDFRIESGGGPGDGGLDYIGERAYRGLRLNLKGRHQERNAACALKAVELLCDKGFYIPEGAVRSGLERVRWPGRFEVVRRGPAIILDCAHNPQGAEALRETLAGFDFKRLFLVIGVMADKDIRGIVSSLLPLAHTVIATRPRMERAATVESLMESMGNYPGRRFVRKTVRGALGAALREARAEDAICVTGSVFTVGEARRFLGV